MHNEIEIMKKLNSVHCVKLIESFEDNDFIYIVMEYCNQGTLLNYVLKNKPSESQVIEIFI